MRELALQKTSITLYIIIWLLQNIPHSCRLSEFHLRESATKENQTALGV